MNRQKKRGVNKLTVVGFVVVAVFLIVISFILFLPSEIEISQDEFDFLTFHLNACKTASNTKFTTCNAKKNSDSSLCDSIQEMNVQDNCKSEVQLISAIKNKNLNDCPETEPQSIICSSLIHENKTECASTFDSLTPEICNFYFDTDHVNYVLNSNCNSEFQNTYSNCIASLIRFNEIDKKIRTLISNCGKNDVFDATSSCIDLIKTKKVIIK